MLRKLVEFALAARLVVTGLALVLVVLGVLAYRALPIDAYPDIAPIQVQIILKAPGMTPKEVETRVVTPIEVEMIGIPKQQLLRSTSKYGIADITVQFNPGTDIYWARQQISERLTTVRAELPGGVTGGLAPIATPLSDVYMFTIEGPGSLTDKRTLLDWTIRPALRTVQGVADVNALGGKVETFQVQPDPAALAAAGLTIGDLRDAIEKGNRNDGAGRLAEGEESLIVRAVGAVQKPGDIAQMIVRSGPGGVTRVSDVATVSSGSLTRYGAVTESGRAEAVQGLVVALRNADANKVVQGVKAKLKSLKSSLPQGTTLHVFNDRSELVGRAVSTVQDALMEATAIVVLLLLVYLGNWRAALIVAVTLPMAALITFILMQLFGLSANLMSLGGLAIAIGVLVDGSIVVVENVVERLNDPDLPKHQRLHRVFQATSEVVQPVGAGIVIIALVFLPLLSLQGLEGKLFSPVAITIVFALIGSLIISLTLVPVLASYALKRGSDKEPWLMRTIRPRYTRALDLAFDHKRVVIVAASLMLVGAVVAYQFVGSTFMPTLNEGSIVMQLTKLPSITLKHSLADDLAIQRQIMKKVPEVTGVVARTGSDQLGLDPMSLNETDSYIQLKPKKDWRHSDREWLVGEIRKVMATLPGVQPVFTQPIQMRVADMLSGSRGDLAVKIYGEDNDKLSELAGKMKTLIEGVKGATDVTTLAEDHVSYLELDIDRLAAGRAGLSVSDFQDALRAQLEGLDAGVARLGQRRVQIMIKGDDTIRDAPSRFENMMIRTPSGELARVSDMAMIKRVDGPVIITHEDGHRYAAVQASVEGRDLVGFVKEIQGKAQKIKLPQGYHYQWGGQFENQQRASTRLMIVVPIALGLIFIVLYAALRSLRATLVILANIPFAMVGGIVALLIAGAYISVPASVGFIALIGIAVLNGLVMVSYIRDLRKQGTDLHEAVRTGAERRLRPVLMTASITALGLVPLLFASGPGSSIQRPLAIVVIGGLITSTLLTLILLPIVYERFGEART